MMLAVVCLYLHDIGCLFTMMNYVVCLCLNDVSCLFIILIASFDFLYRLTPNMFTILYPIFSCCFLFLICVIGKLL